MTLLLSVGMIRSKNQSLKIADDRNDIFSNIIVGVDTDLALGPITLKVHILRFQLFPPCCKLLQLGHERLHMALNREYNNLKIKFSPPKIKFSNLLIDHSTVPGCSLA